MHVVWKIDVQVLHSRAYKEKVVLHEVPRDAFWHEAAAVASYRQEAIAGNGTKVCVTGWSSCAGGE